MLNRAKAAHALAARVVLRLLPPLPRHQDRRPRFPGWCLRTCSSSFSRESDPSKYSWSSCVAPPNPMQETLKFEMFWRFYSHSTGTVVHTNVEPSSQKSLIRLLVSLAIKIRCICHPQM
ncbi:unnamed protein product [Musa hybrid cultivar]